MLNFQDFPIELQKIIQSFEITKINEGRVGDKIVKLTNSENKTFYLKISKSINTHLELINENEVLNWLLCKGLNVPKVIFFKEEKDSTYMLLSKVPGIIAYEITNKFSIIEIIKICAIALQRIHSIDASTISLKYRNCLETELNKIYKDVKSNLIDIEAFRKENNDKTPQLVLEYLFDKKSIFNEDVFTHGDYCLPNILIADRYNYGFVDWSQAGIGDRYRDLSAMEGSIKRNFGSKFINLFYEEYGIKSEDIEREKITYYKLVDQFFYHKKI